MSNSLIDHEHIRVLVWAGLQPRFGGPLRWGHHGEDGAVVVGTVDAGSAAELGAALVGQNEAVFDARHDWDDDHEPYEHAAPERETWTAVEVLKAIDHYLYHAMDEEAGDHWTSIDAAMYCEALRHGIVANDPRWDVSTFDALAVMNTAEYAAAPLEIVRRVAPTPDDLVTRTRRPTGPARRTRSGRPHSPVPWMLTGADGIWVWDPGQGLVRLTDPFADGDDCGGWELAPDGASARYTAWRRGRGPVPERRRIDLVSGSVVVEPEQPPNTLVFDGGPGLSATVHSVPLDVYDATAVVTIERDGDVRELEHQFAVGLSPNLTGPSVQFSLDRRWAAVGFGWVANPFSRLDLIDLDSSWPRRYSGFGLELVGSGAVSPDGSRLLVLRTEHRSGVLERETCVLRTWSRETRPVAVLPGDEHQRIEYPGWIDDRALLAVVRDGRQVSVRSVDPDTGAHEELAGFRMPMNGGDVHGFRMAPLLVQSDPGTLAGKPESATP
ncbi:hypothetical protein [Curtobacterium pusillum]|uniref:hypothetical protein n=1 Tax=Curtobacterium pusillum TaxID=69373 RepID=UPI0011A213A8|nr:hypothetical protein [Curtobacterium pusillum]